MEGGGGEDPFGSLIKLCRPTSSQELKLQTCPFAREFETFPDALDSLGSSFSPAPSQSPPPGIVMVSLPESEDLDSPIDENAPIDNEEFQTPPEEHHLSSSSSQEDPQRNLKPISAVDKKIDIERATIGDGNGDNEPAVENLGFSGSEETRGGVNEIQVVNCLEIDDEVTGEFNEFAVPEGESEQPALKKIRVSQKIWDSMMHTLHLEGAQITEKVDDDADDEQLINLDIGESDEEIGLKEDKILIDVDSAVESGDIDDNVEVSNNGGKGVPDCKNNREFEVEKIKNGGSHGDVSNPREEKEGIHLDNGEKSVSRNGDMAVAKSVEGLENKGGGKLGEYGKEVLGCINREDIDAFKYNGGGDDNGYDCWKEVVKRRRELPLSMREKGSDRGGKIGIDNLDVEHLSWKELLDALAVLLKKVDHGNEDVDFLETAKKKGLTFPQPRWI